MTSFLMNNSQQANGGYEVHNATAGCAWMPKVMNQMNLGTHVSCHGAVSYAKTLIPATAKD